jgi:DNA-binding NarL/FixJ family response regulator
MGVADAVVIQVVVISEVRLLREGLAHALRTHPPLRVIATVARTVDALPHIRKVPTVALLDLAFLSDRAAVRALVSHELRPKVVAFAVADADTDILACAEAGLSGFVLRDYSVEDVAATVERVARDELSCSPRTTSMLFRRIGTLAAERPALQSPRNVADHPAPVAMSAEHLGRLTSREVDILHLLDAGLSNKEISARLNIELGTVKNHVHHILEKLEVERRGQAAAAARASRRAAQ